MQKHGLRNRKLIAAVANEKDMHTYENLPLLSAWQSSKLWGLLISVFPWFKYNQLDSSITQNQIYMQNMKRCTIGIC